MESGEGSQSELDRVAQEEEPTDQDDAAVQSLGAQFRSLSKVIVIVAVGSLLLALTAVVVGRAAGQSAGDLVDDIYEISGSRLTGILTMAGVTLLVAASAISVFTARVTWTAASNRRWSRFLLGAGFVTALLAVDDHFSVHEFPGEALTAVAGGEPDWGLKNILEAGVLGLYAVLLLVLLWNYRSLVAATDWLLLGIAATMLLTSLAIDMMPLSWLAEPLGIIPSRWGFVEDTFKLIGISFFATYWVRTSAGLLRTRAA